MIKLPDGEPSGAGTASGAAQNWPYMMTASHACRQLEYASSAGQRLTFPYSRWIKPLLSSWSMKDESTMSDSCSFAAEGNFFEKLLRSDLMPCSPRSTLG